VWLRIEKDLLLKSGWITKSYVHIRRKKEEELLPEDKVVMDVKIGRLDPSKTEGEGNAELWEKRPAGIWIKRSSRRHDSESKSVVTAVDVLFGADAVDPRPGWTIRDQALQLDYPKDAPEARISIRRGAPKKLDMPVPRVRKDGKFKIMQLADLHLSTGLGACRDAVPPGADGKCEADPRTFEFVTRLLDQEKPDFVVLSGDQVNGETAPDAQSVCTPTSIRQLLQKTDIYHRQSSNSLTSSHHAKYPTQPFTAITTTKALLIAMRQPNSSRLCLIP
jgi:hypothetical protein